MLNGNRADEAGRITLQQPPKPRDTGRRDQWWKAIDARIAEHLGQFQKTLTAAVGTSIGQRGALVGAPR